MQLVLRYVKNIYFAASSCCSCNRLLANAVFPSMKYNQKSKRAIAEEQKRKAGKVPLPPDSCQATTNRLKWSSIAFLLVTNVACLVGLLSLSFPSKRVATLASVLYGFTMFSLSAGDLQRMQDDTSLLRLTSSALLSTL